MKQQICEELMKSLLGWQDGSVKSTCCLSRGPMFDCHGRGSRPGFDSNGRHSLLASIGTALLCGAQMSMHANYLHVQ